MTWIQLAYRRKERLGSGSGGEVYRAKLWRSGQTVAVKCVTGLDPRRRARMLTEVDTLASLDHPNIVRLVGFRRERRNGLAFVMEYIDGVPLAQILKSGPLPLSAALFVARAVLQALGHAHEQGIVHRDVSPNNVLISRDGDVKLADFGLAMQTGHRPTTSDHVSGTLPYVAPEQVLGCALDGRADLFAVGVLLHVMLTGQAPFPTGTQSELMAQILGGSPSTEALPSSVVSMVTRLLERQREHRYQSAETVLAAIPPTSDGRETLIQMFVARTMAGSQRRSPLPGLASAAALAIATFVFVAQMSNGAQPVPTLTSSDDNELSTVSTETEVTPAQER